jgi:hypothetical protein
MPSDVGTRAMVVALKAPHGGAKTSVEIHALTGLPIQTISNIYARAIRRGFEPNKRPLRLKDAWFEDAPLSKRTSAGDYITALFLINRFAEEKMAADINRKFMDTIKRQDTSRQVSKSKEP